MVVQLSWLCICLWYSCLSSVLLLFCIIALVCSALICFVGCIVFGLVSFPSITISFTCWEFMKLSKEVCDFMKLLSFVFCWFSAFHFWGILLLIWGGLDVPICPCNCASSLCHTYFVASSCVVFCLLAHYGTMYLQALFLCMCWYNWSCR